MKKSTKSLASRTARVLDTTTLLQITGSVCAPRDANSGIVAAVDAHCGQVAAPRDTVSGSATGK